MVGNNFVFGAYTHCSWPAVNRTVADPAGKSFLFSLVNASGNAVRFSLWATERAIRLNDRICFGADKLKGADGATGGPNFMLMFKGRAADEQNGNCANVIDDTKAYQSDDGTVCDHTFLAGQKYFAAEEIEVYQL